MHISELLQNRVSLETTKKRVQYSYQDLGLQMQPWFPKKELGLLWSLFYKYGEGQIRDAYSAIRKTNIHSVPYLIGILKKIK